jgi:hypothetical protein
MHHPAVPSGEWAGPAKVNDLHRRRNECFRTDQDSDASHPKSYLKCHLQRKGVAAGLCMKRLSLRGRNVQHSRLDPARNHLYQIISFDTGPSRRLQQRPREDMGENTTVPPGRRHLWRLVRTRLAEAQGQIASAESPVRAISVIPFSTMPL